MNINNLVERFDEVEDYWSPKVIGELNDQYVKIAKLKGEFVWHDHEFEDEMFFIVKGSLELEFEDKTVYLNEGDFYIVPKKVKHKPHARADVWVMLVEAKSTKHTGDVETKRTRSIEEQLGLT